MDLNNDGHRDILSGSYSRMGESMAGLFQVLWGQGRGKFKQSAVLNGTEGLANGKPGDYFCSFPRRLVLKAEYILIHSRWRREKEIARKMI